MVLTISRAVLNGVERSYLTSFKVSWYDFPYTDNTLLANGDRYTVFIDRVCKDSSGEKNAVRLGILYFPKDYYPSRERPVSYKQLRGKLGMGSEDNMFGH